MKLSSTNETLRQDMESLGSEKEGRENAKTSSLYITDILSGPQKGDSQEKRLRTLKSTYTRNLAYMLRKRDPREAIASVHDEDRGKRERITRKNMTGGHDYVCILSLVSSILFFPSLAHLHLHLLGRRSQLGATVKKMRRVHVRTNDRRERSELSVEI